MAARKTTKSGRGGKSPRGKGASKSTRKSAARGTGKKAASKRARRPAKKTAGKSASRRAPKSSGEELYTLTEIGKMASVSMPTLQKYKKRYADRIPSVGEGRRQRYPKEAVAVFRQLKKENLAKRGRPPKAAGAKKKRPAARGAGKGTSNLLTLTEIGQRTGISYPTLQRYVKLFIDRIPHEGTGRKRRYPEGAVPVFRQLRSESRPGRPKSGGRGKRASRGSDAALNARLKKLEKAQADLGKQLSQVVKLLKKPVQVTIRRS